MKTADLHTHTALCNHASGKPEEYLQEAIRKGLSYLGVSDHFPAPDGYDAAFRMMPLQYNQYRDLVRALQNQAEGSGTTVLYSAEFDYVPGRMREVMTMLNAEDFDYRIGSIHYIGDFAYDDPDLISEWQKHGVDQLWERYVQLMCEFINGYSFQVIAHPDLPKKFGMYHSNPELIVSRMRDAFDLAAAKGMFLEINTAGLRYEVKEIYPSRELLASAFDAGLNITLGSDAHKPQDTGRDFDKAIELAKSVGYRSAYAFSGGVPIELPFE